MAVSKRQLMRWIDEEFCGDAAAEKIKDSLKDAGDDLAEWYENLGPEHAPALRDGFCRLFSDSFVDPVFEEADDRASGDSVYVCSNCGHEEVATDMDYVREKFPWSLVEGALSLAVKPEEKKSRR